MELRYTYTTAAAPVQAEGMLEGRPFYFRSRHQEWTFAVAERDGVDPVDLESSEGEDLGWVRHGRFDAPSRASYLGASGG
jgi:hypothetical protein